MSELTEREKITPEMAKAWLDYETAEQIPLDEGNAAYDKRVRMLKHAFMSGYLARTQNTPDSQTDVGR